MGLTNIAPKISAEQLDTIMMGAAADMIAYKSSEYRMGQALMNRLYHISPELYDELTASSIDPFYQDKYINAFGEYIIGGLVTFSV